MNHDREFPIELSNNLMDSYRVKEWVTSDEIVPD